MRLTFLAALVAAASMLMIPTGAQAFGCGDSCAPPTIGADSPSTTVPEGTEAAMTGTYTGRGTVTLRASVGTISAGAGQTWTWHWTPGDGPRDSRTVTVSIENIDGTSSATFDLNVQNVAPSAAGLNAPAHATTSAPFSISLAGATDPSPGDAFDLRYAFDCGNGFGSFTSTNSASCSTAGEGFRTVRGQVKDRDGWISATYSQVVGVFNPVTATEGQNATKSFSGIGTVCAASTATGTATVTGSSLSWSAPAADGPQTIPVTISVELPSGGACLGSFLDVHRTIQFDLVVTDAPPTATLDVPALVRPNTPVTVALTSPSDPSAADRSAGYRFAFACGSDSFGTPGTSASQACPGAADGAVPVKARIYDRDGSFSEYTASVPVDDSPPADATVTSPAAASDSPASPQGATTPAAAPQVGCKVPKLRDKKLAAARRALAKAHCRLGKVRKKHAAGIRPGRVAAQSAKPGRSLKAGARVNLVVGR